jgi:hypothetical protein
VIYKDDCDDIADTLYRTRREAAAALRRTVLAVAGTAKVLPPDQAYARLITGYSPIHLLITPISPKKKKAGKLIRWNKSNLVPMIHVPNLQETKVGKKSG